jgi:hypothetical protein
MTFVRGLCGREDRKGTQQRRRTDGAVHATCCAATITPPLPPMVQIIMFFREASKQRAIYRGELPVEAANKPARIEISRTVRFAGLAVRTIFIGILIVVTAHVASPQIEHIWSLYETPGDLVRVALGFAVCVWLAVHLFILPKDAGGYRTWLYLGFAILPLSVLCAIVIW